MEPQEEIVKLGEHITKIVVALLLGIGGAIAALKNLGGLSKDDRQLLADILEEQGRLRERITAVEVKADIALRD